MTARRRFYREVSAAPLAAEGRGEGYLVLLDGKPVLTPLGAALTLPNARLAEAVAQEWRAQSDAIRPETMILTKLANTAIDRVASDRAGTIEHILAFAKSDLLCYRAAAPAALAARQAAVWDPLLFWAEERYGAKLCTGEGLSPIAQPQAALGALGSALAASSDFTLSGLQAAAALMGSAIAALALEEGRLDAEQAFATAELDACYQAQTWGRDHEAELRALRRKGELAEITRFLRLLRE